MPDGSRCDDSHLVVQAMRAAFDAHGRPPSPGSGSVPQRDPPRPWPGVVVGRHRRRVGARPRARRPGSGRTRRCWTSPSGWKATPTTSRRRSPAGFTISGTDEHGVVYAVGSPVDPRIVADVFVPPEGVSTELARGLLPATVPHADAAADAGAAALLVAALAGQPDQLWRATRDFLHQHYRREAMPRRSLSSRSSGRKGSRRRVGGRAHGPGPGRRGCGRCCGPLPAGLAAPPARRGRRRRHRCHDSFDTFVVRRFSARHRI